MVNHPKWTEMVTVLDGAFEQRLEKGALPDGGFFLRSSALLPPGLQNKDQTVQETFLLMSESVLNWLPGVIVGASKGGINAADALTLATSITKDILLGEMVVKLCDFPFIPTDVDEWASGDLSLVKSPVYDLTLTIALNHQKTPPMFVGCEVNVLSDGGTIRSPIAQAVRLGEKT